MEAREIQNEIYKTIRIIADEIAREEIRKYIKTLDFDKIIRNEMEKRGVNRSMF